MATGTSRRDFLRRGATAAVVVASGAAGATMVEAAEAPEQKPVTKAGVVRSLLTLADKATKAGMQKEAEVILEAAKKLL